MARADLPSDVRAFLDAHIDSATELEVLLFLHERPLPEWDGKALADVLGMDVPAAEDALGKLHAYGLVTRREHPSRLYRYAPPTPAATATIERLAQICAAEPFAVARYLVVRQTTASVRRFSDAFRIGPAGKPVGRTAGRTAGADVPDARRSARAPARPGQHGSREVAP